VGGGAKFAADRERTAFGELRAGGVQLPAEGDEFALSVAGGGKEKSTAAGPTEGSRWHEEDNGFRVGVDVEAAEPGEEAEEARVKGDRLKGVLEFETPPVRVGQAMCTRKMSAESVAGRAGVDGDGEFAKRLRSADGGVATEGGGGEGSRAC